MFWKNLLWGLLLGLFSGGIYLLLVKILQMPIPLSAICTVVFYGILQKIVKPDAEKVYIGVGKDEIEDAFAGNSLQIIATFEEKLNKLHYLNKSIADVHISKEIESIRLIVQKILKSSGSKIDKSTNMRQQLNYYLGSAENIVEKHLNLLHNVDLLDENTNLLTKTSPALGLIQKSLYEILEKTNADLQVGYQIELEVLENQVNGNKK